jgi:hypothetical protein
LDNPEGRKTAGPGAVWRPGIGAIDPVTGKVVGSDTDQLGHEYHARLGVFPL